MEYLFVYKEKGWWLKISTIQELIEYEQQTNTRWYEAFNSLVNSKEFTKTGKEHASNLAFAIGMHCQNNNLTLLEGVSKMASTVFTTQFEYILKGFSIYINPKGGWHPIHSSEKPYTEYCRKPNLTFPAFKESDIRIKQFPGGTHWYAYIGNIQLTNGDIVKWDKYQDAYEYAKTMVEKEK